jgi:hypothetical protein
MCKELAGLNVALVDSGYAYIGSGTAAQIAQRLENAYKIFIKSAKGKLPGFPPGTWGPPGFKSRRDYPGIPFKAHRLSGWRWDARPEADTGNARKRFMRHGRLTIRRVPGAIKLRGELPVAPDAIRTADVLWRAGRWWLSVVTVVPGRRIAGQEKLRVTLGVALEIERVESLDGGRVAAPEVPVSAGHDGGITQRKQVDCGTAVPATPESGGERGASHIEDDTGEAAATPDLRGERGGLGSGREG